MSYTTRNGTGTGEIVIQIDTVDGVPLGNSLLLYYSINMSALFVQEIAIYKPLRIQEVILEVGKWMLPPTLVVIHHKDPVSNGWQATIQ